MDSKLYQEQYRRKKEKAGWKYFSIMVPHDCYWDLKKFYLHWKSENLNRWKTPKK